MDTLNGHSTFYHGIINNLCTSPALHLTLFSDTVEFGYPNIAYTGNGSSDNSSIIGVNYSGKFTFAGFCAINYNGNTGLYSSRGNIKSGNTFINLLSGAVERWGDYSGNQRVYNDPGYVWVSGTFGKKVSSYQREYGTWIAKLKIPAPDAGISNYNYNGSATLNTYPNPVSDIVFVDLSLEHNAIIDISIYDNNGKLVRQLLNGPAEAGKNILSFSTKPLAKGIYFLTVKDSKNIYLTKEIVKG